MKNKSLKKLQILLITLVLIEFVVFSFFQINEQDVKQITAKAVINQGCSPDWHCTNWSECIGDSMIRSCVDFNLCESNDTRPIETQSCGIPCTPEWICDEWQPDPCKNTTTQIRSCRDASYCNVLDNKPSEIQTCEIESDFSWIVTFIIIIVIIFIVGTILIIIQKTILNKKDKEKLEPKATKKKSFTETYNNMPEGFDS